RREYRHWLHTLNQLESSSSWSRSTEISPRSVSPRHDVRPHLLLPQYLDLIHRDRAPLGKRTGGRLGDSHRLEAIARGTGTRGTPGGDLHEGGQLQPVGGRESVEEAVPGVIHAERG